MIDTTMTSKKIGPVTEIEQRPLTYPKPKQEIRGEKWTSGI
jgi:hypothetical protein